VSQAVDELWNWLPPFSSLLASPFIIPSTLLPPFDENSLWDGLNIEKGELWVKGILAKDLGFVWGPSQRSFMEWVARGSFQFPNDFHSGAILFLWGSRAPFHLRKR
jgi:hypothetical protein